MDELIGLYSYLLINKDLKDKLISNEKDFLIKEELLLSGVGIIKNIIDKVSVMDNVFLINEDIKSMVSDLMIINKYLINEYGEINGYIVYDVLSLEYDKLYDNLKRILNTSS